MGQWRIGYNHYLSGIRLGLSLLAAYNKHIKAETERLASRFFLPIAIPFISKIDSQRQLDRSEIDHYQRRWD